MKLKLLNRVPNVNLREHDKNLLRCRCTKLTETMRGRKFFPIFLLCASQFFISFGVQLVVYELLLSVESFADIIKDFTALVIINELDDIVGSFVVSGHKNYSSVCVFRKA